jgi:predicted O-methyltransferase YrrM
MFAFDDSETGLPPSPRRLNALARVLGAKSYLEIGVSKGQTFKCVVLASGTKVAVDPNFQFDYQQQQRTRANVEELFVQEPSDVYFSTVPKGHKFDLVFLDGLHTFEQTYRDFCNCLAHAHERTVVLIDDTVPNSPFSAINDQRRSVAMKKHCNHPDVLWHGDVYKVIFAIHDFHPAFRFATVKAGGKPQTLVWRAPGGVRRPVFNDLEKISRLTFFDLLEHPAPMNYATENEALERCVADVLA